MPVSEGLSILVVDDDEDLSRTLGDILELNGYAPVHAATGREGLARLEDAALPIPVAIVDLRLPDMDGLALADALRALSEQTQVIILTGNASIESAVEALRHGSRDYLVKPVDPEQLLRTIRTARERYQRLTTEDALRRTQERHRILLESLSELILLLDRHGTVQYVSPASERMLGYAPDPWVGRSVFELVHEDDLERVRQRFVDRVREGGVSAPFGFRVRHADGRWRTVEVVAANHLDNPDVGGLVVTVRDVTETRALEQQLADARRIDSIGRLAGGVAHDFNNLLTVMLSGVTMLRQELEEMAAPIPLLDELQRATESASRLTRQLLAFGRRQHLEPEVLDLNELIRACHELLGRVLREDLELQLQLHGQPAPVLVDPAQLEQVLMNLVVNARDAMPEAGRIVIETALVSLDADYVRDHPQARTGPHVMLSVTDTGEGIDEETRLRLFEPFFTTKGEGRGTGLGLATVHGIVHQSGGNIWVYSEPGLGTTFKVYLPRAAPAVPVNRAVPAMPTRVTGTERVFVVEDNDAVRRLVEVVLTRSGYRVEGFPNTGDALHAMVRTMPDMLISDVVLPDGSGRDLVDRVRARHPGLPVLFISGFAHGAVEFHGTSVPPEHFLQKPFTAEELLIRVRRALDLSGQ